MKDPITVKQIQEKSKEMKMTQVGFWLGKASGIELSDKDGLCMIMFMYLNDKESFDQYLIQAGLVLSAITGKTISVKTICTTGLTRKTCVK